MKLDFLTESLRKFSLFAFFLYHSYNIVHHLSLITIFCIKYFRACADLIISCWETVQFSALKGWQVIIWMVQGPILIDPASYFAKIIDADKLFCDMNGAVAFKHSEVCAERFFEEK